MTEKLIGESTEEIKRLQSYNEGIEDYWESIDYIPYKYKSITNPESGSTDPLTVRYV